MSKLIQIVRQVLGAENTLFVQTLKKILMGQRYRYSYSEFGEDAVLLGMFHNQKKGFYVDVGAHHPHWQSNTFSLYKLGWHGINIDASELSVKMFDKFRKRDANIHAVVSDVEEDAVFYEFGFSDMNTMDLERAKKVQARTGVAYQIKKRATKSLATILAKYKVPKHSIDFFSIDAEGNDLKVLKSNDWDLYAPKAIFIENHFTDMDTLLKSELNRFLESKDFQLFNILGPTLGYFNKKCQQHPTWPYIRPIREV